MKRYRVYVSGYTLVCAESENEEEGDEYEDEDF